MNKTMSKKIKRYDEAEIIKMFNLKRLAGNLAMPLMTEWANTSTVLNGWETEMFEEITKSLLKQIVGWNEGHSQIAR